MDLEIIRKRSQIFNDILLAFLVIYFIKGELSSFNTVYGQYRGLRGFTAFETVKSIRRRIFGRDIAGESLIQLECLCSAAVVSTPKRKESGNVRESV